jgi:hypothetical protein
MDRSIRESVHMQQPMFQLHNPYLSSDILVVAYARSCAKPAVSARGPYSNIRQRVVLKCALATSLVTAGISERRTFRALPVDPVSVRLYIEAEPTPDYSGIMQVP